MKMLDENLKKNIHFIGIGGIGMSAIADVVLTLGHIVSGSDLSDSEIIQKLRSRGAKIWDSHLASNIQDSDLVVVSSAIDDSNPEIKAAREKKIPIMKRAEMLAELMHLKQGIAIAGTHGKTTTSSLIATLMKELGLDPSFVIGGIVSNLGGNSGSGEGEYLVAEADESDGSFLFLTPTYSVITNIELDHVDYYKNEAQMIESFTKFANKIPFYGHIVLNGNDKNCAGLINNLKNPYLSFAID